MIKLNKEGNIRILHVDDNIEFAEMATAFLERENDQFETETAKGANNGLSYVAESTFDCVISDYDMPSQNGIEFLEDIREQHPNLPFILYTGKGSEEVASDAISSGATDYIQKDTGADHFKVVANRIETVVNKRRSEESRRQYARTTETIQEGIAIIDSGGNHINVNQPYADIHRANSDELLGEHWSVLYTDKGEEHIQTEVFPSIKENGYWEGQITGKRTDGTRFIKDCAISATPNDMMICTVRDVSEQVESRKHVNRYQALIEVIKDPVYVIDEEGQFKFVNEAFVETFGYEQDEVLGEDVSLIKDETAVKQGENNLRRVLSSDGDDSVFFETEIQPKSGKPIPCEDHMTALPYEGDDFDGSAGILRDVSEQKAREQELERQNERLDEFAGVISHDLRNPLNVAKGNLHLLSEKCDSERIETIDRSLTRMEELISNLLQLARTEDKPGEKEPINIEEIFKDCWQNVETADATANIKSDREILADRSQLARILENLVRNAVEHNEQDVTTTIGDLENGFYIEDDGNGIPKDKQDDVLEAGYSTNKNGVGFGLSIVKEIVEAHRWNLDITEGTDGGARFEITNVEDAKDSN